MTKASSSQYHSPDEADVDGSRHVVILPFHLQQRASTHLEQLEILGSSPLFSIFEGSLTVIVVVLVVPSFRAVRHVESPTSVRLFRQRMSKAVEME